jgi:glycosyltransferase involved in cell wall biosynthesis
VNVKIVSCWFATSYGTYTDGLRRGLERRLGREVGIIASNCGCGDPMEVSRKFVDQRCSFIEFPNVPYATMSSRPKQLVLDTVRKAAYCERARRYMKETGDADVVHFQQILNAFGSITAAAWLDLPCKAARVVTVHELDPYQQKHPELSTKYAKADALVVHTDEMRAELIALGAWRERVHVVQHGVDLGPAPGDEPRSDLIFYGGHKLENGKGALALFAALAIVKEAVGSAMPRVRVHGHYTETGVNWAKRSAKEAGLERDIDWLDQIDHRAAVAEYRRARAVILPYTGGFAGYPASLAAASGAAVIGTRRAGLREHLGENALFVPERDPTTLAAAIVRVVRDEPERRRVADAARAYAERELGWDTIAKKTASIYEEATARVAVSRERPALHG